MKIQVSNQQLIEGCSKNKRKWQELLYKQYFDAMFAIGRRYTYDDGKIIEWVNNGFLKVFQKINLVKNPEALPSWIKTVVYRSILDGIRSEKKHWQALIFDMDCNLISKEKFNSEFDYELLLQEIELLPLATKNVFKLYVFDGCTHKVIANELAISIGTSKWHLNNARKKLQTALINKRIVTTG